MVELLINDELASIIRLERTFMTPIFSIADPQQRQVIRLKGKISEITVFQVIYLYSLNFLTGCQWSNTEPQGKVKKCSKEADFDEP